MSDDGGLEYLMYHFKVVVDARIIGVMEMKNVWYCRNDNLLFPPCSLIVANFYTPIKADLSDQFTIDSTTTSVWQGDADGVWYDFDSVPPAPKKNAPWSAGVVSPMSPTWVGGDSSSGDLPYQMAPCVYMKTNQKHVIGRKYFGGYTEAYGVKGLLNTTALGHLNTVVTGITQSFAAGGTPWHMEIWGPKYGFQSITSAAISEYLGTQRRRKPGIGV
jgi:hypothetical protein